MGHYNEIEVGQSIEELVETCVGKEHTEGIVGKESDYKSEYPK